jgi:hypothetical protein
VSRKSVNAVPSKGFLGSSQSRCHGATSAHHV